MTRRRTYGADESSRTVCNAGSHAGVGCDGTPPCHEALTRRTLLSAFAALSTATASPSDFWNRKDPSKWTSEEIDTLATHSPWAVKVHAEYPPGLLSGCSGTGRGGVWSEQAPIPFPLPGPYKSAQPKNIKSEFTGQVRWESAQPLLDAIRQPLHPDFANHYVIRVSGFPIRAERDCAASTAPGNLDKLKQFATLQKLPNGAAHCDLIQRPSETVFLFGFPKSEMPIHPSDLEIKFQAQLDRLVIPAKFTLKDMRYHGVLAV